MRKTIALILCILLFALSVACAESESAAFIETDLSGGETVVNGLIALWEENGIYVTLPSRSPAVEGRLLYRISEGFTLIYDYAQRDGKPQMFYLSLPEDYAPTREACILSIQYFTRLTLEESTALYDSLLYNRIDGTAERDVEDLTVRIAEISGMTIRIAPAE